MISCCGFDCEKCPLYIASLSFNAKTQKDVTEKYGLDSSSSCQGCLDTLHMNSMCKMCLVRKCCTEKKIQNCGYCDKFPDCNTILPIYNTSLSSRNILTEEHNIYLKKQADN